MPILPLILINGSRGIGSGFSTYIPSFSPLDIIKYIRNLNNDLSESVINPYIMGY